MPSRSDLVAALAARHERDRRVVEQIAAVRVRRSLIRLQRLTIAAWEMGVPVTTAINAGLEPLKAEIEAASGLAALYGVRRTQLSVQSAFENRIELAAFSTFDNAVNFLNRRLGLSDGALESIRKAFAGDAIRVIRESAASLERFVQQAVFDTFSLGGGVREGRKAIRDAFTSAGFDPVAPHRAEAIFRTQTQLAYSAGRQQSLASPAVQEILWGFEYTAAVDDRTTDLCRKLDGVRRPKDDPFWKRFQPPNHWGCRATTLEIFTDDKMAKPTAIPDGVQPAKGFDFNPGDVYTRLVNAA